MSLRSDLANFVIGLRQGVCQACGGPYGRVCTDCMAESGGRAGFVDVVPHQAALDRIVRLGRYYRAGAPTPLAATLLRFKYRGDRAAGHALRSVFGRASAKLTASAYVVVVPIPLHPHRLRDRGYNQAAWLARGAARSMRAAIDTRALERVLDTPPQAGAGGEERRRMHRAFLGSAARLDGRSILLVDDVYTTGTTLAGAAHAARNAGAVHVSAAVLLLAGHE